MRPNRYDTPKEIHQLYRFVTAPDRVRAGFGVCLAVAVLLFLAGTYVLGYVLRHGFHEKFTPLFR